MRYMQESIAACSSTPWEHADDPRQHGLSCRLVCLGWDKATTPPFTSTWLPKRAVQDPPPLLSLQVTIEITEEGEGIRMVGVFL